jgi:hypothetical protein
MERGKPSVLAIIAQIKGIEEGIGPGALDVTASMFG